MKRLVVAQIIMSVLAIIFLLLARVDLAGNLFTQFGIEHQLLVFPADSLYFISVALFAILLISTIFANTHPQWIIACFTAMAAIFCLMIWHSNNEVLILIFTGAALPAMVLFLYANSIEWQFNKAATATV
ncbi:MAG: hypothetical protein NUV82_01230, partial [Candidatus Komeilibacteria bacterium]|nr:hypothetical protein [Candidatus Komeilibacteria bacterium]